jgi:hypothetical protein
MARKLERIMADLPAKRRAAVEARAGNLTTLKDLRQAVGQNRQDLAANQSPNGTLAGQLGANNHHF